MRTCKHGLKLERGLVCDHGYIQVRLWSKGMQYCANFGPHNPASHVHATKVLADKRAEIQLGKFGIEPEIPEKLFKDVVPLWFKHWSAEVDGDGRPKHGERSLQEVRWTLDAHIVPFFGSMVFHTVKPIDIQKWRVWRLKDGVLGTTVNRQQNIISSIFSKTIQYVALEKIKAFKVPAANPCEQAERAKMRKRTRILTKYEAGKLKLAFSQLQDFDGWEICKMALKSVLSEKDLRKLEIGSTIDTERSKTGVPIHLPVTVLAKLNFHNWRHRWIRARNKAGLSDLQFRDLRKSGGNWLLEVGKFDMKHISQFMGHANVKTTEDIYTLRQHQVMKPLADTLNSMVEGL